MGLRLDFSKIPKFIHGQILHSSIWIGMSLFVGVDAHADSPICSIAPENTPCCGNACPSNPFKIFVWQSDSTAQCTTGTPGRCTSTTRPSTSTTQSSPASSSVLPPPTSVPQSPVTSTPPVTNNSVLHQNVSSPPASTSPQVKYYPGTYDYRDQVKGGDMCATSATIDGRYACSGTHNLVQGANLSNMLTQTAGSTAVMAMGQGAQMQAYQTGTQEAAMRGAAETQINTGKMQTGLGSINAALGAFQIYKYMQHDKNTKELTQANGAGVKVIELDATGSNAKHEGKALQHNAEAGYATASGVSDKIINKFRMNDDSNIIFSKVDPSLKANNQAEYERQIAQRKLEVEEHQAQVKSSIRGVSRDAQGEQAFASQAAMAGGMMSMITGSQQVMQGSFAMAAGNKLLGVANSLKNMSKGAPPAYIAPSLGNNISAGSPQVARMPAAITGSGDDPAQQSAAEDEAEVKDDAPELGNGFGPNALPSNIPGGPPPGKFTSGGGEGGGGGGGGGVSDGGSTSAASGTTEDPQAKMAPTQNGANYESAGGVPVSGGGGGGKGADGGPDLSGLLAKFLPQQEDPNKPKNGILDYGSKAGSEAPDGSILGREGPTLFERATKTYRDKASHGIVGT